MNTAAIEREKSTNRFTTKERISKIQKMIRYGDKRIRRRFPILANQNKIGATIFLAAIAGMISSALLYYYELIPGWSVVLINACLASLLHELEHDLIHGLYFRNKPFEAVMFWGVWLFRGNTPNPYYRRKIHKWHHQVSGQNSDIEEQLIGNGMKFGPKRFLVMFDQTLAVLLNYPGIRKNLPEFATTIRQRLLIFFPIQSTFNTLLFTLVSLNVFLFLNWALSLDIQLPAFAAPIITVLQFIGIVYIWPNVLRQSSLQLISSNMHYFGDVTPGPAGLLEQCQVLKPWFLIPFQLFCFNFGSTHSIHHFVVNQPFYLRQLDASYAHAAMRKYGVRFNDLGTFRRANRFQLVRASAG